MGLNIIQIIQPVGQGQRLILQFRLFHTGHGGRQHGNWLGMLGRVALDGNKVVGASFEFVRHNAHNETVICNLKDEQEGLDALRKRSTAFQTLLEVEGNAVVFRAAPPA